MAAGIYNFTIEQGSTFTRTFKYKDATGTAISLADHSIRMQLRTSIGNSSTVISLTETQGANDSVITVGGTSNNEITVTITATDTAAMSFDTAVYDLEIQTGSTVTRLLQGKIKLSKEVTRD
jgi:hypothetical protein|tara:strand:- start:352 stop:717 length:366 start_codon:yes stop_codon:yes gene_type:complete